MSYQKTRSSGLAYYLDPVEHHEASPIPPRWYAAHDGAGERGALGVVDDACWGASDVRAFLCLGEALHPSTQRPLVRNSSHPNRVALHDFTFSAPKSVSVAWALADDGLAHQIALAQHEASRAATDVMARHACSRQGRAGIFRAHVGILGAMFVHGTSRANDPHLHSHSVIFNVAPRADGSSGAIEVAQMLHWQGAAGCLHAAELAWRLRNLGFTVKPSGRLFELADVPSHVCHAFSTRRQDVEREVHASQTRRGHVTNVCAASVNERQRAVQVTRKPKLNVPISELRPIWRKRAADIGFDRDHMNRNALRRLRDDESVRVTNAEQLELARATFRSQLERSHRMRLTHLYVEVASSLMGQADAAQIIDLSSALSTEIYDSAGNEDQQYSTQGQICKAQSGSSVGDLQRSSY